MTDSSVRLSHQRVDFIDPDAVANLDSQRPVACFGAIQAYLQIANRIEEAVGYPLRKS